MSVNLNLGIIVPFLSARSDSADRTRAYWNDTESVYVVTFG